MTKKTFCEAEQRRLHKLNKFQLPNRYKKIGYYIMGISFSLMIAKIFFDEPTWVKPALSNILLLGFLMVSISKEKIEDEFIVSLRSQSDRIALILGVLYSIIQPYVNYFVEYLLRGDEASLDFSYFQVLYFILLVQLMFFHQLRKYS